MLREVTSTESAVEPHRRWFADDFFELIVWLDETSTVEGFQLCYDRGRRERALTWTEAKGFRHDAVDDGESSPLKNQTPLFRKGGDFDGGEILRRFRSASALLPRTIAEFVDSKISEMGSNLDVDR